MALFLMLALAACQTEELGTGPVYGAGYYGSTSGFNDPWYYGGYYDDADIIATPPSLDTSPRPSHPIASPRPTPMPYTPRVAPTVR
jgi:hypothetical protein